MGPFELLHNQPVPFEIGLDIDQHYAEGTFRPVQPIIEIIQNHLDAAESIWLKNLCYAIGKEFLPEDPDFAVFAEAALKLSHYKRVDTEKFEESLQQEEVTSILGTTGIEHIQDNPREIPKITYVFKSRNSNDPDSTQTIEVEYAARLRKSDLPDSEFYLAGMRFQDNGAGFDKAILAGIGMSSKKDISWNRGGLGEGLKVGFNRLIEAGCQVRLGSTNVDESWGAEVGRSEDNSKLMIVGASSRRKVDQAGRETGSYTELTFPHSAQGLESIIAEVDPRDRLGGIGGYVFEYGSNQRIYPGDDCAIILGGNERGQGSIIYVRGLGVASINSIFPYNMGNKYGIVGRDRSHISDEAIEGLITELVTTNGTTEYFCGLIQEISSPLAYREYKYFNSNRYPNVTPEAQKRYIEAFRLAYPPIEGKKTLIYDISLDMITIQEAISQGHRLVQIGTNAFGLGVFLSRLLPDEVGILRKREPRFGLVREPGIASRREGIIGGKDIGGNVARILPVLELLGIKTTFGNIGKTGVKTIADIQLEELKNTYQGAFKRAENTSPTALGDYNTNIADILGTEAIVGNLQTTEILSGVSGRNITIVHGDTDPGSYSFGSMVRPRMPKSRKLPIVIRLEQSMGSSFQEKSVELSSSRPDTAGFLGNAEEDLTHTLALLLKAGVELDLMRDGRSNPRMYTQVELQNAMDKLLEITQSQLLEQLEAEFLGKLDLRAITDSKHTWEKLAYSAGLQIKDTLQVYAADTIISMNKSGLTPADIQNEYQRTLVLNNRANHPINRYNRSQNRIYQQGNAANEMVIVPEDPTGYQLKLGNGQIVYVREVGGKPFGRQDGRVLAPYVPLTSSQNLTTKQEYEIHNGGVLASANDAHNIEKLDSKELVEENKGKHLLKTQLDVTYGEKIWNNGSRIISDLIQNHKDADPNSKPEFRFYLKNSSTDESIWVDQNDMTNYPIEDWSIQGLEVADQGKGYVSSNLVSLGQSTKRDGGSLGVHGEGLKMLVISCLRNGLDLEISSRDWEATPRLGDSLVHDYLTGKPLTFRPVEYAMNWFEDEQRGSKTKITLPEDTQPESQSFLTWQSWVEGFDPRIEQKQAIYENLHGKLPNPVGVVDIITQSEGKIYEHRTLNSMKWPSHLPLPVLSYNFNTNLSANRERTELNEKILTDALSMVLIELADVEIISMIIERVAAKGVDSYETKLLASLQDKMTPGAKAAWRQAYYRRYGIAAILSDPFKTNYQESYVPAEILVKLPKYLSDLLVPLVPTTTLYSGLGHSAEPILLSPQDNAKVADALTLVLDLFCETMEHGLKNHNSIFSSKYRGGINYKLQSLRSGKSTFRVVNSVDYLGETITGIENFRINITPTLLKEPRQFLSTVLHELFHFISQEGDYTERFEFMFAAFTALRCELDADKIWLPDIRPDLAIRSSY